MRQTYDLVVVADGGWSGLRRFVTKSLPVYAGYVVWRGMVDTAAVPGFRAFGIFKNGIYDTIAMPLTTDSGKDSVVVGVFIATPEAEVQRPGTGASRHGEAEATTSASHGRTPTNNPEVPSWFIPFFRRHFGHVADGELVRLMEAVVGRGGT